MLEYLRTLPKRHVVAWLVWGVGAIVLIGTALILSPADQSEAVFRSLPRWHQVTDIVWAALGILLVGWGLLGNQIRFRHKVEDQLDQLNAKVDLLLAMRTGATAYVTEYQLPPPRPDASIGWVGAVTDTLKVKSLTSVDEKTMKNTFARITDPTALVNAALDQRVTIKRVLLNSPSRSATPHAVHLEVANNTASKLTLLIPKGQVFENATRRERVQNLVVSKAVELTCPPKTVASVTIPAYCLNRDLEPPDHHVGNITPLKVRFEFANQKQVWSAVKEHTA